MWQAFGLVLRFSVPLSVAPGLTVCFYSAPQLPANRLRKQEWWNKWLCPCHSWHRPGLNCWLLPGPCGHLEKELTDWSSCFLCLSKKTPSPRHIHTRAQELYFRIQGHWEGRNTERRARYHFSLGFCLLSESVISLTNRPRCFVLCSLLFEDFF